MRSARTQGDGMENTSALIENINQPRKCVPGENLIYRPSNVSTGATDPVIPKGKIINLVPKTITCHKDKTTNSGSKVKEPKFVLYEPYKAAVTSIIPKENKVSGMKKNNRNNLDLNTLVAQMSVVSSSALKCGIQENSSKENNFSSSTHVENVDVRKAESEVVQLKQDNSNLESRLIFQTQINAELKTMLVAAVGEDMQTRVNLLTEDKLQLARALLNTAQNLSTHQEQIEWLAGQCEVWRSKFLASSLMVEELAKWKTILTQRTCDLNVSTRLLLNELNQVKEKQLDILKNLESYTKEEVHLGTQNLLELTDSCLKLTEKLCNVPPSINNLQLNNLTKNTEAQEQAEQLLRTPIILPVDEDAACRAVVCQAGAVGGSLFPVIPGLSSNITHRQGCPYCTESNVTL